MRNDWRNSQLPPPEGSEDQPDGFISIAIVAFVIVAPLIYFRPELGAVEVWMIDAYHAVDGWVAPIRGLFFADGRI